MLFDEVTGFGAGEGCEAAGEDKFFAFEVLGGGGGFLVGGDAVLLEGGDEGLVFF